ncbi:MAG: hypothetical protein WC736_16435 [Gallionella sp.]|jgi:hypothetical protein
MTTGNVEKKKASGWMKYLVGFVFGFITNFSGVLENITKIPSSYHDFKATYLYDKDLLNGSWSTNAEYVMNSREKGLDIDQPNVVLTLNVDHDGGVEGEIISKKICDALPITWIISFESDPPSLKNLFVDRSFFIKQLHNGDMETVAELKLVDQNKRHQVITFKTVRDTTNSLPKFLTFGKALPSYGEDFKRLSAYCAGSSIRLREALKKDSQSQGAQKH